MLYSADLRFLHRVWSTSTVVNVLKRREYLGHTVNFKTRKHFKDKKSQILSLAVRRKSVA
ncbi:hypothetical protein D7X94_16430 [Acutalibacter sp. 1XD8-33]|nr:hypothetical protein D7X94_16430 [Acutalibacter sp. 1XD8-33]